MSGKVSNFGGKKAAPFAKGGKRRKRVIAKAMVRAAKHGDSMARKAKNAAARKALG